jgi:hypothetical protein
MNPLVVLFVALVLVVAGLSVWRHLDHRADRKLMQDLALRQPLQPSTFTAQMVADLPEPARRYFLYTIEPGTPLYPVAEITMSGHFGLGDRDDPNYLDFSATQILAAPAGFVWKMRAKRGLMRLSGSDSQRWTRFWLSGFMPIARLGGDQNHTRSAFGRHVAEAVFWAPAALLPGPDVHWELLDMDCTRVTVCYQGLTQSVDVTVAPDGQPTQVSFERWSNANPQKIHRLQPFGGYLSVFRKFSGYRLPTHVEAGNHFGTEEYFPFFVADVTDVKFPHE